MIVSVLDHAFVFWRVSSPLQQPKVRMHVTFTTGAGDAVWCKKVSMSVTELVEVRTLRDIFMLFPRLHDAICTLALPRNVWCSVCVKARGGRFQVSGFFHEFLPFDSNVIF
jgi:hypothetical protein